jgi:predicted ATPase/DNA-binding SARP family transcriptional activator/DNA-binding CsgD family transcriptional regulator
MHRRPKHHQHRGTTAGNSSRDTTRKVEVIRIKLLGGFRVWVGPGVIGEDKWHLRKARSLIKLLALSPGHRLHREQIMDALWPDLGTKAASNNLRRVLHSTRKTLDPAVGSSYLASEEGWLALCPAGALWVDVEAFEEAAATARREREPAAYRAALELYAGELLPADRYEEWAEDRRQQLRRLDQALLVEVASIYEERGEYGPAIEALTRVTAEEPAHEEAHAGLMRLYALAGNNGEALAQYGRLEEALSRALGTEPAASSRVLREEIAAGRFPPTEGQSLTSQPEGLPEAAKHNLPAARSSFVGRETELRNVKRDLAMTRLLTLTGAGGCGKTRLALEVARQLVGAYPDGVWLVELAPLSEEALVAHAVAAALGVKEQPDASLTDALVDFLQAKRALLVLDNCEHLVDAVARLVDTLLNSSRYLRVVATSRESLNVEGELNWLVPSLSVPGLLQSPTMKELESYESVRLFVERARHRNPAFSLKPQNAHAVARICERLDGIPLAIELAAARVGLSVEQIAQRLDDSLRLLSAGSRTASPRQRTLRGTLDWSYALLSEPERRLFGGLSVFAGGWTLESAEVVGAGGDTEQSEVLDLLSRLVEKSLVVAQATGGGGVRYRMLEPVRQYAREKLEERGEADEVRRQHASFFLALAEDAEPKLQGPEDVEWLERLEVEHDNMRAALSWALQRGEDEVALRLAGALGWFWESHGHYSEGRRWLEEALAQDDRVSMAARVKALDRLSELVSDQQDLDRAEALAQEGLKLSEQAGLGGAVAAEFLRTLGWIAMERGDYARMKEVFEESLRLSRDADNKWGIADALLGLGTAIHSLDDRERGKELYQEGIGLARELGYAPGLARFLLSLGYTLLLEGDYERGAALNEEAAALFRERGYKGGGLELALDNLGWAALLQGDYDRARTSYQESLTLCKELGDKVIASESLEGMACIAAAEGDAERAARLFGVAQALREVVGYHHRPEENALREPYLADARSQLEEASWEVEWAEGRAMSMEQAIEYALSQEMPLTPPSPGSEQPSSDEPPTLTRREMEVAILVARGLTNRQIASELVLSEHTVHHHVTNILKKLNLSSRQQVASRLPDR